MCILFVACGDALTGSSGFLTSENFPSNFSKDSDCAWNITVPVGHIIRLTFLNFTLEPNEETDCSDSLGGARVFITNVDSDDGAQEFKLCGQNIPNPVYSVGNFVQVRLLSLNNVFSGFNLTYEAISPQDGKYTVPRNVAFCIRPHSRTQRLQSIWSAPRIATSERAQFSERTHAA